MSTSVAGTAGHASASAHPSTGRWNLGQALGLAAIEAAAGTTITACPHCPRRASLLVDRLTLAADRLRGIGR